MDNTNRNTQEKDTETTQQNPDMDRNNTTQNKKSEGNTSTPEINNNDEGSNDIDGEKHESEIMKAEEEKKNSQGKNVDASEKRVTADESQRNVV